MNRLSDGSLSEPMARHESAVGHVTGRAIYTDELPCPPDAVWLYPVQAQAAHALIRSLDVAPAMLIPGVLRVITARDIPGVNDTGPIVHDEPLIPTEHVSYFGQALAWVVAESESAAREGAARVGVELETLPAILSIDAAVEANAFHLQPARITRGDCDAAMASAPHQLDGVIEIGGQDHFYLETHTSWSSIDSEGVVQVVSSTQHPSETQHMVAHALGVSNHRVVCRCLRMGGGFGGKETQANAFACMTAIAAKLTGRTARIKLPRSLDMQLTGKRHPFKVRYAVGFDALGSIHALRAELIADGGWSVDLSPPVLMRAMVHIDNAYFLPNVELTGRIAKTHLPSNTAFRGFGGPQGMVAGEEIIDRIARHLGVAAELVRERNFYRDGQTPDRNQTHYGQAVVDNHLPELWTQLKSSSEFEARRSQIEAFNKDNPHRKRGIAITPVKFGISFNKTEYNQAGALVLIYQDGSVQLNHGGTEMGQGLHSKMIAVAARALGVSAERIQIMTTSTDKVPNTSATAASSGSDLNGQAVKAACDALLDRLKPVAAALLQCESSNVLFANNRVCDQLKPGHHIEFEAVIKAAYNQRISLAATGFYRTPEIHWDAAKGQGHPFYYFSFGAAVSEVEVDGDTGVHQLLRVDLLHDCGDSIIEAIDRGQIEGGFVQGLGWLTCEELRWHGTGRLLTDAPSTYKIPTDADVPKDFHVHFFRRTNAPSTSVILHSKGVGEPPLMLAISVREALREAVAAFAAKPPARVELAIPATPEAIWRAVNAVRFDAKR